MNAPPRDAEGCVEPHNHTQIQDEDIMLRGIPEQQIVSTSDGGRRISTGAFRYHEPRPPLPGFADPARCGIRTQGVVARVP